LGRAGDLVHVEATAEKRVRFEDFYRAERATLIGAVVFALGDTDLGIEASDEALVRAYERWTDVAAMSNPMGWVYRVAVNVGYKRTRRLALERRRPLPHGRDAVDLEGLVDPAVTRALAELPFEQREVIVLRFHLDWSIDEIAEVLGCPSGTVKSRLHRGLQRLETKLKALA
jgi:RNA polymerase sigma factor (sigma-70 family)